MGSAHLGFAIAATALVSICLIRFLFLWVRKCVCERRGIGTSLKEVVLQELDNMRTPMGGEYDEEEDSSQSSPSTATRQGTNRA